MVNFIFCAVDWSIDLSNFYSLFNVKVLRYSFSDHPGKKSSSNNDVKSNLSAKTNFFFTQLDHTYRNVIPFMSFISNKIFYNKKKYLQ